MANSETKIPIPARLENVAVGGHVAGADMIIDDIKSKTQDVINSETDTALGNLGNDKANKSEMSVTPGTGTDADKTTIQLKTGTTATVLTAHQDISGKADKSTTVTDVSFDSSSSKIKKTINGTASDVIGVASTSAAGLMSSTDKTKLEGIATGAEVNVNADWNASSGDAEILNKPTLGTAASKDVVTTVDTSGNPVSSGAIKTYVDNAKKDITDLIPSAATTSNQLADKSFVNSSIATATATYKGSKNLVSDLSLTTSATTAQIATALATAITGADNNDYAFVQIPTSDSTPTQISRVDRYKYNGTAWSFEYSLNNSSYTADQWAAINSGITSSLVTKLSDLPTNSSLTTTLGTKADKSDMSVSTSGDKTTITLKSGTSAVVLNAHQDISGKANKSEMSVTTGTGTATIQLKSGISATVLTSHQDISGKADKSATVSTVTYDTTNKKLTKTINGTTTDIATAVKIVEDGGGTAAKLNFLNLPDLAHDYTFKAGDALCIDGVIYKCTAATANPPFNFVFDANNSIVYETLNGQEVYVVDSNTLNSGWEKCFDVNDRYFVEDTIKTRIKEKFTSIDMAELGMGYATNDQNASVAARTVTVNNFVLKKNGLVSVRFTKAIVASNATLNVNGTGAKTIKINGENLQPDVIRPNMTVIFQYDGTYWEVVSMQGLEQGSANSTYFVDLGLPSGVKWARRNINISNNNKFAPFLSYDSSFFSWGNTDGQNAEYDTFMDYSFDQTTYNGTNGSKLTANIASSLDAARVILGAPYRLPTSAEFQELLDNCDFVDAMDNVIPASTTNKLVTIVSTVGINLKSKKNGNSIFFPCCGAAEDELIAQSGAGGWYWTSSYSSSSESLNFSFTAEGVIITSIRRYLGLCIRPVM